MFYFCVFFATLGHNRINPDIIEVKKKKKEIHAEKKFFRFKYPPLTLDGVHQCFGVAVLVHRLHLHHDLLVPGRVRLQDGLLVHALGGHVDEDRRMRRGGGSGQHGDGHAQSGLPGLGAIVDCPDLKVKVKLRSRS